MAEETKSPSERAAPETSPAEPVAPPKAAAPAARPPAKPAAPSYNEIKDDPLIDRLKERFGASVEAVELLGQQIVRVNLSDIHEALRHLRDDEEAQFDFLTDLTAVHYPEREAPFEIVYHLFSFPRGARLRVKTAVAEGEAIESAVDLWSAANWMEREVYDLFGIRFEHHPDMRRILLPADWEGHPLRKEHALEYRENDWVRRHLKIREVHPETDQTGKYEMTEFVKANR